MKRTCPAGAGAPVRPTSAGDPSGDKRPEPPVDRSLGTRPYRLTLRHIIALCSPPGADADTRKKVPSRRNAHRAGKIDATTPATVTGRPLGFSVLASRGGGLPLRAISRYTEIRQGAEYTVPTGLVGANTRSPRVEPCCGAEEGSPSPVRCQRRTPLHDAAARGKRHAQWCTTRGATPRSCGRHAS